MAARHTRLTLFFAVALVALVAAGLWYQQTSSPPEPVGGTAGGAVPAVGNPAPDFRLRDLSGRQVRLSDFKGKPVFINFWATWCRFCQAEWPVLEEAYRKYGATGKIVFLAVDTGEGAGTVRKYLAAAGATLPALLDQNGEVAQRYLVQGLPTSYFIARNGTIRDRVVGAVDRPGLRARLEALLP